MLNRARGAVVLAASMTALVGCGGEANESKVMTTPAPLAGNPAAGPAGSGNFVAPPPVRLSASSYGPMSCSVYESGNATQVIFESRNLDVRAECQALSQGDTGTGYLWGYERIGELPWPARLVCYFTNPQTDVSAKVIQDTTLPTLSALQRAHGSSACRAFAVSGWQRRAAHRGRPR